MIKISTEFDKLDYTFNRSLSTVVTLPYDKDDVLLGVNELVNGYNFNSCVEKLQSNLMYLYSVSKLADPNIPTQYEGFIGTATDSGEYLDIGIKNFTPYRQGVAAFEIEDYSEMPYFYVSDSDNNTYNIVYSYGGKVNPDTTDGSIPSGTTTTIPLDTAQYGNDLAAVYGARQALSAYFSVYTYRYNEIYGGTNAWPVLELSSFNIGGTFFGGADYATIGSLLSQQPATINYQQGSSLQLFKLFENTNTQDLHHTSIDENFNNLKSISVGPGTLSGYNCVFCCSPDHISALSANTTSTLSADYTFTNVTSSIGINNDLNFQGINASAYAKNTLYVSDSTNNSVYRINVNGFTRDDNIRNNNFYETEIIGGLGGVRDNYSFNNPKILQYHNDELYVLDQGNNCIKIYDQDLGFVRNLRKTAFTKNNPPATIKMYNNNFYWLTTTGILFILDDDLNPLKSTKLYNNSNSEEFIDFIVAKDNNNLYVTTRENIYKYFFDNLEFIGRFNLSDNKIDNTAIEFLTQIDVGGDTNRIYAYAKRNKFGALLVFNEKNAFETLLSNYTFDIYSLDEIKVDKNEFVSNFSYNKSIIKLLSNNLQLSNYISNTVSVTLLRDGGIQFDGITYFNDSELKLLNYDPTLDNYIGTNEIFSRTVANRVLNKIYEYQLLLVKLFSNQVTPPQQQVNILSPGLMGLMLEDFPGNANGYYRLEQGETNRDAILLEDKILPQKAPPPPPPPQALPAVVPECQSGWYDLWPNPAIGEAEWRNRVRRNTGLDNEQDAGTGDWSLNPAGFLQLTETIDGVTYYTGGRTINTYTYDIDTGTNTIAYTEPIWDYFEITNNAGDRYLLGVTFSSLEGGTLNYAARGAEEGEIFPDDVNAFTTIRVMSLANLNPESIIEAQRELIAVPDNTYLIKDLQDALTPNQNYMINGNSYRVLFKWRNCAGTEIVCPPAKTPYTDENMFSNVDCSPPLALMTPFADWAGPTMFFSRPASTSGKTGSESSKLATFYGGYVHGVSKPNDDDNYLNYHILYTGVKTYKVINQNNKLTSDITFGMYRVPTAATRQNIGAWDYVAKDKTSLNYNWNLLRESEYEAGAASRNFDCFENEDFVVYFKFQKSGEEPSAFFNNTKSEEYRLKFEEGDPAYFGNVYDKNGCHLYKLLNGGQKVDNTDKKDIEGGETIPVQQETIPGVPELICSDVSWEDIMGIVRDWHSIPGNPHYFTSIIFYDIYGDKTPNGYTTMTRAAEHNECYIVPGNWENKMERLDQWA